jgi:hypothetical protein
MSGFENEMIDYNDALRSKDKNMKDLSEPRYGSGHKPQSTIEIHTDEIGELTGLRDRLKMVNIEMKHVQVQDRLALRAQKMPIPFDPNTPPYNGLERQAIHPDFTALFATYGPAFSPTAYENTTPGNKKNMGISLAHHQPLIVRAARCCVALNVNNISA